MGKSVYQIYLSSEQKDLVSASAENLGLSLSAFIRMLVMRHLGEYLPQMNEFTDDHENENFQQEVVA